jgi:hypothetical protein
MRATCALLVAAALLGAAAPEPAPGPAPHFVPVDVFVDSGEEQLAAWQVELTYDGAEVQVLSLEGGEPAGFREAPYYDPAGMTGGRIVVAAFVVEDDAAPAGRSRVARLHLRAAKAGSPLPAARLVTAARPGGRRIAAEVELLPAAKEQEDQR